jgi:hypothetical protein
MKLTSQICSLTCLMPTFCPANTVLRLIFCRLKQMRPHERWHEDGTFDQLDAEDSIKAGVLQIIASELVGQVTQQCAGESEMRVGINEVFAARREAKRFQDAGQKATTVKTVRKKRKHSRRVGGGPPPIEPSNH